MSTEKYPIIQSNGQRVYQSSPSPASAPPRGSELFIGNLPRDLFEDYLIPLFAQAGPIFKLRLMMDFSGTTRGFCFVQYFTVEDANQAVLRFNGSFIESKSRSSRLSVHISVDNCRLYFGNVPREKTGEEIQEDLERVVDGVLRVIAYAEQSNPSRNRGFAFVEFESHAKAAIARRRLLSGIISIWVNPGHQFDRLYVDWAEPEPIVNPMVLMQVKILYFRNVPISWTSDRFKNFTLKILTNLRIVRVYKKDNYAFVHFYDHSGAEMALTLLRRMSDFLVFSGKQMEVEWARPSNYSKKSRENLPPDNLCTSVPPRLRKLIREAKRNNGFVFSSSNSSKTDVSIDLEKAETGTELAYCLERLSLSREF